MERSGRIFSLGLVVLALLLAGCQVVAPDQLPLISTPAPVPTASIPNPASVYCEEQGGQLDIRQDSEGNEYGVCVFADGSECEEWAFFRGECAPDGPTETETPAEQPAPAEQAAPPSDELAKRVQAELPQGAFEGVAVLPLATSSGQPLWAVHSTGLRNFQLDPLPSHFVAIFTYDQAGWQELARVELDTPAPGQDFGAGPDYLDEEGVSQIAIVPDRVWLQVEGGVGAHGGTYQLLSFDGHSLRLEVSGGASSPGVGRLMDLNDDGVPEVVLDVSDPYIFCYACNVSRPEFQVFAWDAAVERMVEVTIQSLEGQQVAPETQEAVDRAVALAEAGLWSDALTVVTAARETILQGGGVVPATLEWDWGLIKLYYDANMAEVARSAYPLLARVFAGDYDGAVDIMRRYSVDEIFNPETPLLRGTAAEGWEDMVSNQILERATAALAVKPDLAAAYFLRGWAEFLAAPPSPQVRADLAKAAELAPEDALFVEAAKLRPGPKPVTVTLDAVTSHLEFSPGISLALAGGGLVANRGHRYVLRAQAGQVLDVAVSSPTGNVVLTVEGADGTVLAGLSEGRTHWRGQLPATQEYIVTVVSLGRGTSFTLTATMPSAG